MHLQLEAAKYLVPDSGGEALEIWRPAHCPDGKEMTLLVSTIKRDCAAELQVFSYG